MRQKPRRRDGRFISQVAGEIRSKFALDWLGLVRIGLFVCIWLWGCWFVGWVWCGAVGLFQEGPCSDRLVWKNTHQNCPKHCLKNDKSAQKLLFPVVQ